MVPNLELLGVTVLNFTDNFMGQCHEIFDFRFFYESVSPKPLSILLGPFRFEFSTTPPAKFAAGVVDTGRAPSLAFSKKIDVTLMKLSGLGGR